ncbi:hypothetical protein B4U79_00283, partial [Dinothrombium tinctorium]
IIPGFFVTVICLVITLGLINSWGLVVYDLSKFPKWAEQDMILNSTIATITSNLTTINN